MASKHLIFILVSVFFFAGIISAHNKQEKLPPNGVYKTFYANGELKEKGHYKKSLKKGLWYFYDENGMLEKKEKYKQGELQWQLFFRKGKIMKTIDKNGKVTERPKCGC